ncbi:hypothetical protein EB093_01310 [bacterium]|nr:hypothetical protein [bacterium]
MAISTLSQNTTHSLSSWGANFSIHYILSLDLVSQWRRCGHIADFLANYHVFNFKHPEKAFSALSTVTNELLENAIKFSTSPNKSVSLSLERYYKTILLKTVNSTKKKYADELNSFSSDLINFDPIQLFQSRLEEVATNPNSTSGIGLLSIINDYEAAVNTKILPKIDTPNTYEVTVCITLNSDIIDSI